MTAVVTRPRVAHGPPRPCPPRRGPAAPTVAVACAASSSPRRRRRRRSRRRGVVYSPLLAVRHVSIVDGAGPQQADVARRRPRAAGNRSCSSTPAAPPPPSAAPRGGVGARRPQLPAHRDLTVTLARPVGGRPPPVRRGALVDRTASSSAAPRPPRPGSPELVGLTAVPAPGGLVAPVAPRGARRRAVPALPGRVVGVTLGPTGLVVGVVGGPQLRFGDTTQLAVKAHTAAALLGALVAARHLPRRQRPRRPGRWMRPVPAAIPTGPR